MNKPELYCIDSVEDLKANIKKNKWMCISIPTVLVSPFLFSFLYNIGQGESLASLLPEIIPIITLLFLVGLYFHTIVFETDESVAEPLSADEMSTFKSIVEKHKTDNSIIHFVCNIQAQGRTPVKRELHKLENFSVYLTFVADKYRNRFREGELERIWKKTTEIVHCDKESPGH